MSRSSRIAPMEADNMPRSRRRPPDEDPPAAPATEAAPPHPAPAASAAEPGRDLERVGDTSDSASKLASKLAESDTPDTDRDGATDNGDHGAGPTVPLSALTTAPPVDPELDLVNLGVRVPRYLAEAIRTQAFLQRTKQQDVVLAALRGEQPLSADLVNECRRSAGRRR